VHEQDDGLVHLAEVSPLPNLAAALHQISLVWPILENATIDPFNSRSILSQQLRGLVLSLRLWPAGGFLRSSITQADFTLRSTVEARCEDTPNTEAQAIDKVVEQGDVESQLAGTFHRAGRKRDSDKRTRGVGSTVPTSTDSISRDLAISKERFRF
jgi:hypothetical protein